MRIRVEKQCAWCSESFGVVPSRAAKAKFCSLTCYGHWRSETIKGERVSGCCHWKGGLVKRRCIQCDEEFDAKPSEIAKGNSKFCSLACYHAWFRANAPKGEKNPNWKGGRVQRQCKQCGITFEIWPSQLKYKGKGKFCSKQCDNRWRVIAYSGEGNPAWEGGLSLEPYGAEFSDELKRTIRERDDHACAACKTTRTVSERLYDVHHVDYNKRNNSPMNLITLCQKCHGKTGSHRKFWERGLSIIAKARESEILCVTTG